MDAVAQAFSMVFEPYTIVVMVIASLYGLFVGAVPGLTATMATALLVPVTFFMPPIPAIAAMVTATAMAIFSGDIPGCLLRIPGTPASAAYTDEAYAMTRKGEAETALGAGLVFSAVGGLFGTAVLIVAAPALADFALNFSSFEYFWLVLLGLTCAVFITSNQPLKGVVTLLLGPAGRVRRPGQSGGLPALHLRQCRDDGRHRHDRDDDRHVRHLGNHPLRGGHQPARRTGGREGRQRHGGPMGAGEEVSGADPARQRAGHGGRCVAGSRRRHRGLDVVRHEQEVFQGAGEVRHRPRRGHRRVGLGQQQRTGRRVDSGAGVRHSRRLDHRHRDRRALHEEHEPGADAVHHQPAEHLCRVPAVHRGQHHHDPAGHPVHQGGQAASCACPAKS